MKRTFALLCGVALTHGACASDDPSVDPSPETSTTSSTTQEVATTVGIERIIPIHYYVLDNFWAQCSSSTPDDAIYNGVKIANRTWQQAGIQFTVSAITRSNAAPNLMYINNTPVPYSTIWPELKTLLPTLTATSFPAAEAHSNEDWLFLIGDLLPRREIPMIVPCSEPTDSYNGHSAFPWFDHSHNVHIPPWRIGTETVSHELGHYLGLVHEFEASQNEAYDELYGLDLWNNVTFFHSAVEVANYRSAPAAWFHQVLKKDGVDGSSKAVCQIPDPTTCEMQCTWGGHVYKTSTDPDALNGISHRVTNATSLYATNFMGYWWCPRADSIDNLTDMMPSQIERVRASVRSTVGDRNLLGRGSARLGPMRSSTIDFDGDGKRDLAFFRPETSECVARWSRDNGERWIAIAGGDPAKGDQPMPGDYDGDGKTDCAVFRPGTATAGARWLWTSSRDGSAHDEEWGGQGDVPIADLHLPASDGYGHYAIYRPSTGEVWWRTSATTLNRVSTGAGAGDEIVFGDYDRDGKTDLAFWQPQLSDATSQARLRIAFSSTSYASIQAWNFGLEGDVALGPVRRDADGELDFALWRPSNGVWYYLLNPRPNGSSGYLETGWGIPGDVPVQGFDFDRDGRDDEVIWRPAGTGTSLWIRRTSDNGYYSLPIGVPGDVPFFGPDANFDGVPELYLFRPSGQPTGRHFEAKSSGLAYPTARTIPTAMRFTDIEL